MLNREWVTVVDPDNDHLHYTFDVSFLLSNYECIYGNGCPGVDPDGGDPDKACCIHGAYMTEDDGSEEQLIADALAQLGPDRMQFHELAITEGVWQTDDEGERHTRIVDGACLFANRADFDGRIGCALHHLADDLGEHHMTHKPVVCWQVPLHRAVEEKVANDGGTLEVHTIAAYERGTWGEGGADFHWWCTEEADAYVAKRPLFESMEHELREMVGDDVYEDLTLYLRKRSRQHNHVRFLPLV